jgi:replicative DNA helicase
MLAVVDTQQIHNVESEAALCGGLMYDNRQIDRIADILSPDDFYEPLHGRIFAAIISEHSKGHNANPITLKLHFADDPSIAEVGGVSYLATLSGSGAVTIGAVDFAREIKELAQRRRLIDGLRAVIAEGHNPTKELKELVAEAEETLADATEHDERTSQLTAAQCVARVLEGFNNRQSGVISNIAPIDASLGPIMPKQLVILAARPSMGKSAVASSYGLGAAGRGHGVLFVSLEMSAEELGERIAADLSFDATVQVPYGSITSGHVTSEQGVQVARASQMLERLPFEIVDLASASMSRLNAIVRRNVRRMAAQGKKLELVIVDYLQLLRADHKTKDRYEEVSEVSRGLKALAKANNVGVLALAQLSRKVEERHDKRPIMADLRDSGQIEQDADAIMFLFREEYYLAQAEPQLNDPKRAQWESLLSDAQGNIDFIVAKRRRGKTGTATGKFYGAYQAVRA